MQWLTHLSDKWRYSIRWTTRKNKSQRQSFSNSRKTSIKQVIVVKKTNYISDCKWPSVAVQRRQTADDWSYSNVEIKQNFYRTDLLVLKSCSIFIVQIFLFKNYDKSVHFARLNLTFVREKFLFLTICNQM